MALGGGSARGWAHIGVIRALHEAGIEPDMVCGTSVGALVGAVHANGDLDWLENWVRNLSWRAVLRLLDVRLNGGVIRGKRIMDIFHERFLDKRIGDLTIPFAAVATELHTGKEVWLREGSVLDAIRASIAYPGLLTPVEADGGWLVDGGLVNPVPVSLARAMGADLVIAVDLNSDIVGNRLSRAEAKRSPAPRTLEEGPIMESLAWRVRSMVAARIGARAPSLPDSKYTPSVIDVLESSINVMQVRITRSRLAGEPPDILLSPRLGHLGLMDYHRGRIAIDEGLHATRAALPLIQSIIAPRMPLAKAVGDVPARRQ